MSDYYIVVNSNDLIMGHGSTPLAALKEAMFDKRFIAKDFLVIAATELLYDAYFVLGPLATWRLNHENKADFYRPE